ncbi:hypothetical protein [Bacteroides pyogenes]|uniref:hypothetical protein n=1 Tax=Bacteroides pyogenes TaxID=310300 RepID=UPI002FDB5184
MPDNIERSRSITFAVKRQQAQLNMESHVNEILFKVAKDIVNMSKRYRNKKRITNYNKFSSDARAIARRAEGSIESYVRAYARASVKVLGMESTTVVDEYLKQEVFGATFMARNRKYIKQFADDIARMVKAGISMGYDQNKLLSAIRSGYQSPYTASVITKAQKGNFAQIEIPHRGRGVYAASYENVLRNAQNTIHLTWGQAELTWGKEQGYVGYYVHRGSSYSCETCQSEVGWMHDMSEMVVPLHSRCRCFCTFAREKGDNPMDDSIDI